MMSDANDDGNDDDDDDNDGDDDDGSDDRDATMPIRRGTTTTRTG